jgi:hypothetical protein
MNISAFCSNGNVYLNCENVKGIAHKNAASGVESALLPVICADLAQLRDQCAHFTGSNTSRRKRMTPDRVSGASCPAANAA